MFRSDWLQRFAGHGVLVLALLGCLYLLWTIGQSQQQSSNGAGQHQNSDSSLSSIPPVNKPVRTEKYQADCKSEKDADFCAQRRMADAAESQSDYTLISVVLLGLTLIAAAIAAREAHRIVVVTDRSARQQLRAYLHAVSATMPNFAEDAPKINLSFKNCGQTPAYNVTTRVGVYPLPPDSTEFGDGGATFNFGPTGPQQSFSVSRTLEDPEPSQKLRDQIRSGLLTLFVVGRIDYEDAFGKHQWLTFRCAFTDTCIGDPKGRLLVCEDGNDASGRADQRKNSQ